MEINAQKEQFSFAFVGAIAAAAGFKFGPSPQPDDESIDAVIRSGGGRFPQIDLQLKCTAALSPDAETWSFPLKVKNYRDLRVEDCMIPRILIVVSVPEDAANWVESDDSQMSARHSARWISLRGAPRSDNSETVTVEIPRANRMSPTAVHELFYKVQEGEL